MKAFIWLKSWLFWSAKMVQWTWTCEKVAEILHILYVKNDSKLFVVFNIEYSTWFPSIKRSRVSFDYFVSYVCCWLSWWMCAGRTIERQTDFQCGRQGHSLDYNKQSSNYKICKCQKVCVCISFMEDHRSGTFINFESYSDIRCVSVCSTKCDLVLHNFPDLKSGMVKYFLE